MAVERPEDVLAELAAFLNDAAGAHGWAQQGVPVVLARLQEVTGRVRRSPENPDPDMYMGIGDPNLPTSATYQSWKLSRLPVALAEDGLVITWIGRQWIVGVFTGWEHEYRPRLATAYGCDEGALTHNVLGDLRHMRNDVVHHHGVATAANTGRCRTLRWCNVGDEIMVRSPEVADFMRQFPYDLKPA